MLTTFADVLRDVKQINASLWSRQVAKTEVILYLPVIHQSANPAAHVGTVLVVRSGVVQGTHTE